MLRTMFKKTYTLIDTKYKELSKQQPNIPKGLWRKCRKCGQMVYAEDVKSNFYTCPKCDNYFRVHAYRRIEMTADEGTFEEWDKEKEYDRLGLEEQYTEFLGNKVVCHNIPIRPGRNLAIICETAAVNFRQKKMGYNAAQELYKRVTSNLMKNSSEGEEE